MFMLARSSAFFSKELTQSFLFCLHREAAARFRSRKRCLLSSGSISAARRRRPPVGWAGDTWGFSKDDQREFKTQVTHARLHSVPTWGWTGEGASEFWEGCWLCSCLWGTAGTEEPATPTAPSCVPVPWFVIAAFSRCKATLRCLNITNAFTKKQEKQKRPEKDCWSYQLCLGVQTIPRGRWRPAAGPTYRRSWNTWDVRHRVHRPRKLNMKINAETETGKNWHIKHKRKNSSGYFYVHCCH